MASRDVTFTFSSDSSSSDPTVSMILTVLDSGGVSRARVSLLPTDTSTTIELAVGTGYVATLVAIDASGLTDPSPPSIVFDIPELPLPPQPEVQLPSDPTLSVPTIS